MEVESRRRSRKKILSPISKHKQEPVHKEQIELRDGRHTTYLREVEKYEKQYEKEMLLIDILEKEETERIETLYRSSEQTLNAEYEARLNELVEGLYNEYEEKKRAVELEINAMDMASTSATNANYYYGYPNKKTLRRRANDQTDCNDKKPRKRSPQNVVHLLPESVIAQDVRLICGNLSVSATPASVDDDGRHRKVSVDNTRLVCDGKTYHKGQNVSVETLNYGKFPAIIQNICDKFVQFRSTISGDTRQVTATKDDLECGRVLVRKRY